MLRVVSITMGVIWSTLACAQAERQDPVTQLRQRAGFSIVKIVGKGTTPSGREMPFEGSGVVLGSVQDISVIVTAAHVVGKAGTWRIRPNGEPDRELRVWVPRPPDGTLEPLPLAPAVAAQNDSSDFAVLHVHRRLPSLSIGNPFQLAQGAQTVALGYTKGAYTLDVLVGRGQLVTRDALGFVLQLSQMQTSEGNSGGPILDQEGRVLGILSVALRQANGQDLAIPITTIQTVLPPVQDSNVTKAQTTTGGNDALAINACDRLAASPTDSRRPVDIHGVFIDQINAPQAIRACRAARGIRPTDTRIAFQLGRALEKEGTPAALQEAADLYKFAADHGDPGGQLSLGVFYEEGKGGLRQNDREATRLYKAASDQGYPNGQFSLGLFYGQGRGGLPQDDREAARLYGLAAAQGDPNGQVALGFFYEHGQGGLPQNDGEAARLYQLAAEQDDPVGQTYLGLFYAQGRGGLLRNDREAARLYMLAAERGNVIAQVNLALFYENGRGGLPRDFDQAKYFYGLAAVQKDPFAQQALARLQGLPLLPLR